MAELFSNLPAKLIENIVLGLITSLLFGAIIAVVRNANTAFQASAQTASTWAERLRGSLNPFSRKNTDGSYNFFMSVTKFLGASLRLAIMYAYPLFFLSSIVGLMVADMVFGVNMENDQVPDDVFLKYSLGGLVLVLPLLIIRPFRNVIAKIGVFISTPIFLFLMLLPIFGLSLIGIGWLLSQTLAMNSEATATTLFQGVTCVFSDAGCDANLPDKARVTATVASFVTSAIGLYFSWKFWKYAVIEYVWSQ